MNEDIKISLDYIHQIAEEMINHEPYYKYEMNKIINTVKFIETSLENNDILTKMRTGEFDE